MGGSPFLWPELVDWLEFYTEMDRSTADAWCRRARDVGYTTQEAWERIPGWHNEGVLPETIQAPRREAAA